MPTKKDDKKLNTATSQSKLSDGLPAPSELFMEIICDGGTLVATCDFCDRTHFATEEETHYDEGELEGLREKALKKPEEYIEHGDCTSIWYGYIDGQQALYVCECNKVRKYEDWIWENRGLISKYLIRRTAQEKKEADLEAQQTAPLNEMAG